MSLFKNKFKYLLEQDEEEVKPPQDAPEGQSPLEGELDPGVAPEDMGAGIKPGEDIETLKKQSLDNQKNALTEWITKIEDFIEFLNGVNGESVQAKLHDAPCDTMFEKIASSEHKRVARVAVELSALAEAFKGFLIAGDQ